MLLYGGFRIPSKKGFFITTSIAYTNASPHIGFVALELAGSDAIARFHRMKGEKVFFSTGTDEYGEKNAKSAGAAGLSPKAFVDEKAALFERVCREWNISFDRFIRTTDKDHTKASTYFFSQLQKKGFIYKGIYKGLYCVGCEAYYTEKDLDTGKCKIHGVPAEPREEESYFFKLSAFEKPLLEHFEKNPLFVFPSGRREEILNRLKKGLRDLSVSRKNLSWGVPVPGDPSHVQYVWTDALVNYLSVVGYPRMRYKQFWPADIHVVGYDIEWFHAVIWPALLMAVGLQLPKQVLVHGFITDAHGEKMSKSKGNVVDPFEMAEKYPVDALRYYALRETPFWEDMAFSESALLERLNADLADNWGNLVSRTLSMIEKYFDNCIPKAGFDASLKKTFMKKIKSVEQCYERNEFHKALEEIGLLVGACNRFVSLHEPWFLAKKGKKKDLARVLYSLVEGVRVIALLYYPVMPVSSTLVLHQVGWKQLPSWKHVDKVGLLKSGTKTFRENVLFKKIVRST